MKPGQIQVFDGLRLTTEHMNHLQGAFHSAVQDIRQILGLGQVQTGFELVKESDRAVTVMPGVAFDLQKNRVVCDEPRTLDVTFAEGETTKYVCVKYEQVEDGLIEGRPTLIWDSCDVLIRPVLPEPAENLVPIAAVQQRGTETFAILSLSELALTEAAGVEEAIIGEIDADEMEAEEETGEPEEETAAAGLPDEPAAAPPAETPEAAEPPPATAEPEVVAAADSETVAPALRAGLPRLFVQQGIVRLRAAGDDGVSLNALLLEPLRQKLIGPNNGDELHFTLGEAKSKLDFPPASLTCQTIFQATVMVTQVPNSGDVPAPGEEAPLLRRRRFQSTAQGEATFADSVLQYGVSSIRAYDCSEQEDKQWCPSEVTEQGIAHLPLAAPHLNLESTILKNIWDLIDNLQLLVRVSGTDQPGFKIVGKLLWKGGIDEEIIEILEKTEVRLGWEFTTAWKTIGNVLGSLSN